MYIKWNKHASILYDVFFLLLNTLKEWNSQKKKYMQKLNLPQLFLIMSTWKY